MQITEIFSDGFSRELNVSIPHSVLQSRLAERLGDMRSRVRISGFRPGHVPISHLRRLYGHSVMAELVQEIISESSQQAIASRSERPASPPQIIIQSPEKGVEQILNSGADLSYSLKFEVIPVVELYDFHQLKVEKLVPDISEADINEELVKLSESHRPYVERGAGAVAQEGDLLVIDFRPEGSEGEKAFLKEFSGENVQFVLGDDFYIPGLSAVLAGHAAGKEVSAEIAFPDDYGRADIAGHRVPFWFRIKTVSESGEALVGDQLAHALGFEDFDKLKEAALEKLKREMGYFSRYRLKRSLLDALDLIYVFEVPQVLVEQELAAILKSIGNGVAGQGISNDSGKDPEELHALYRPIAERRVRLGLVLSRVGEMNGIKVSDREFDLALREHARNFPGQADQVYAHYRNNPLAAMQLQAPIFEEKVVDHILSLATVSERLAGKEELFRDIDDEGDQRAPDSHSGDSKENRSRQPELEIGRKKSVRSKKKPVSEPAKPEENSQKTGKSDLSDAKDQAAGKADQGDKSTRKTGVSKNSAKTKEDDAPRGGVSSGSESSITRKASLGKKTTKKT